MRLPATTEPSPSIARGLSAARKMYPGWSVREIRGQIVATKGNVSRIIRYEKL